MTKLEELIQANPSEVVVIVSKVGADPMYIVIDPGTTFEQLLSKLDNQPAIGNISKFKRYLNGFELGTPDAPGTQVLQTRDAITLSSKIDAGR
jgi:hypothetical protein